MSYTFEIGSNLDQLIRFGYIVYLCIKLYLGTITIILAEKERQQIPENDNESGVV